MQVCWIGVCSIKKTEAYNAVIKDYPTKQCSRWSLELVPILHPCPLTRCIVCGQKGLPVPLQCYMNQHKLQPLRLQSLFPKKPKTDATVLWNELASDGIKCFSPEVVPEEFAGLNGPFLLRVVPMSGVPRSSVWTSWTWLSACVDPEQRNQPTASFGWNHLPTQHVASSQIWQYMRQLTVLYSLLRPHSMTTQRYFWIKVFKRVWSNHVGY